MVDSRSKLSICVDGAGGAEVTDEDVDAVRDALEDALASVNDPPPEYAQRQVVRGCPPPAERFGASQSERGMYAANLETATQASEHLVHVYFIPPAVYEATFVDEPYAWTAEEHLFHGDVGVAVTSGLYLRSSATDQTIRDAVAYVLFLTPRKTPVPEPIIDWCSCERGVDPNPPYEICGDPYVDEQCGDQKRKQGAE